LSLRSELCRALHLRCTFRDLSGVPSPDLRDDLTRLPHVRFGVDLGDRRAEPVAENRLQVDGGDPLHPVVVALRQTGQERACRLVDGMIQPRGQIEQILRSDSRRRVPSTVPADRRFARS